MPLSAPISERIETPSGVGIVVHDWGGHGDPVLLAHPTGFHGRVWAPIAAKLVRAGRRVWSFDFRGHGDSDPSPNGGYGWEEFADDALAVTRHLDLVGSRRLIAAGHSKGGAALLWASVIEPGVYPRVWCYEPVIVPTDAPILAATRQSALGRGAPAPRPVDVSGGGTRVVFVEAAARRARARGARGLRRLRPAGTAGRHPGAEVPPRGRSRRCTRWARASGCSPGSATSVARCSSPAARAPARSRPRWPSRSWPGSRRATLEVWEHRGHFGPLEDPDHAAESMLQFALATAT